MVWSIFCNIFVGTRFGNALQLLLFWAHMLLVIAAACSNSSGIISLCVGIYFINDPLYEFVQLLRGWLERPQKVRVVFACRRLAFRRVRWSRNSLFRATESLSPLLLSKKYSDHKESGSLESHLQFCSCMQTWSTGLVLLSAVYLFLCTIQGSTLHFLLSEISKLVFGLKVCYFVQRLGFQKSPLLLLIVLALNLTVVGGMNSATQPSSSSDMNNFFTATLGTVNMLSLLDSHQKRQKLQGDEKLQWAQRFSVVTGVATVLTCLEVNNFRTKVVEGRAPNVRRDRLYVKQKIQSLSPRDFKRNYRLDKKSFYDLLSKIRSDIQTSGRGNTSAINSSGDSIDPVIQLAIALRLLAGGSYLDISFGYNVGISTVYPIFWKVLKAIDRRVQNINFDFEDEDKLKQMESFFTQLSKGAFPGTVLAGDGVVFRRTKPAAKEVDDNVRSFFVRKGFYGHSLQAFVDGKCRFKNISMRVCASTHDGNAYEFTGIGKIIGQGLLPAWCNIVLDEAYTCTNQELSPWKGKRLTQEKDCFNYFLSLHRQVVERAFGLLVGRWGIFWRPLRFCTKEIGLIVSVCCKLHNICVDSFGSKSDSFTVSQEDIYWKRTSGHVSEPDSRVMWTDDIPVTQGTRSDLMTSTGRDLITQHIKELDLKRPLHSTVRKIERIKDKTAVTV